MNKRLSIKFTFSHLDSWVSFTEFKKLTMSVKEILQKVMLLGQRGTKLQGSIDPLKGRSLPLSESVSVVVSIHCATFL